LKSQSWYLAPDEEERPARAAQAPRRTAHDFQLAQKRSTRQRPVPGSQALELPVLGPRPQTPNPGPAAAQQEQEARVPGARAQKDDPRHQLQRARADRTQKPRSHQRAANRYRLRRTRRPKRLPRGAQARHKKTNPKTSRLNRRSQNRRHRPTLQKLPTRKPQEEATAELVSRVSPGAA